MAHRRLTRRSWPQKSPVTAVPRWRIGPTVPIPTRSRRRSTRRWRLGGLDILVNNAGVLLADIESFPLQEFDRLVAINVRGVFAAIQRAVPQLESGGRIINIGSISADRDPVPRLAVYAMAKAAVAGLTRGLARELGRAASRSAASSPAPSPRT